MIVALDLLCGIGWSIAYIFILLGCYFEKRILIPSLSICLNISWESLVVVSRILGGSCVSLSFLLQVSWLILDVFIVFFWIILNQSSRLKKVFLLIAVFFVSLVFTWNSDRWMISAFIGNIIMSAEFLISKNDYANSVYSFGISITKLLGTLAATILNGVISSNVPVIYLGGLCLILDSFYLIGLLKERRRVRYEGKS